MIAFKNYMEVVLSVYNCLMQVINLVYLFTNVNNLRACFLQMQPDSTIFTTFHLNGHNVFMFITIFTYMWLQIRHYYILDQLL